MSEKYLLGIDAGTSRLKALLLSPNGTIIKTSSVPVRIDTRETGWVQQDMDIVWDQFVTVVKQVIHDMNPQDIVGIGITGQGDGAWMLDKDNQPLIPAPLWNDNRASEIIADWEQSGVLADAFERLGTVLWPGSQAAILAWLKKHQPDTYQRIGTVFCCKDWLKYKLTGVICTDETDGSIPFMDLASRRISEDLLTLLDLQEMRDCIPEIKASHEIIGYVSSDFADKTGLPGGIPVVNGMLDVAANAIGLGVFNAGQSFAILGTTAIIGIVLDEPNFTPPNIGASVCASISDTWLRVVGSTVGTPSLDWYLELSTSLVDMLSNMRGSPESDLNPDQSTPPINQDSVPFAVLEAMAAKVKPGADGVVFHPFLQGERAPFLNPNAFGSFFGLKRDTTAGHMIRAIYEGVVCSLRHSYAAIGQSVDTVLLSGGGSKSDLWCQILADHLDSVVHVPRGDEYGALGVAMCAGIGAGIFEDYHSASEKCIEIDRSFTPNPDNRAVYDRQFETYVTLIDAMQPFWKVTGKIDVV